ncbi:putative PI31 proteasome regulator [Helianthus anomalus]
MIMSPKPNELSIYVFCWANKPNQHDDAQIQATHTYLYQLTGNRLNKHSNVNFSKKKFISPASFSSVNQTMATEQSVLAIIRASRPNFNNSADKIAFAIHSIFLASGFNLNATGPPAFTDDALTAPFNDDAGIEGWNEVEDNYAFVYSSPDGSKKVVVKCLVMNKQLFVDALAFGSSDPVHLEINIDDYAGESDDTKYSSQYKNLGKLVDSVNKGVVAKLSGSSNASSSNATSSEQKAEDADRDQPRGVPFGLEDPYSPYHPSGIDDYAGESDDTKYSSQYKNLGKLVDSVNKGVVAKLSGSSNASSSNATRVVMPPVYPNIGGGDLYPQPPAGVYPTRGGFGDGGMLVGPSDPRFFGGGVGGRMGFPGGQPGVPPGARFDPFGPPDVPGFEPNRFARNPRRPPGGTHPDLEHFNGSDFI